MLDGNGINATLAHQSRVGDDNTFVRGIVEGYTIIGLGLVTSYASERVDVVCGNRKFTNVEVMVPGVDGWGLKLIPAVNDRVLLFSTQVPCIDLKQFKADGSMPAYDPSGLKAIPLTDSDSAQLITVDKDGIVVTGDNKLTVNADGIQVEDVNGNKVTTSEDGIEIVDANDNTVILNADGAKITDTNDNTVTMASSGITMEDSNGCKIVTSSSEEGASVKINDKLEIKK